MDDDLEIRRALRRHVTRHQPPLTVTAEALVAAGRRRGRWRAGLSYGAGSVATVVTITGALTVLGSGGGQSTLDNPCRLPLAAGWRPEPSRYPSGPVVWPSAMPSTDPSYEPSTNPSYEPSTNPSYEPSTNPSYEPSFHPSYEPSFHPTDPPVGPAASRWVTPPEPSGTTRPQVDSPRVEAATCYLAQELRAMFPSARFAPAYDQPPMVLHGRGEHYRALGTIVGEDASTYLILNITAQDEVHRRDGHGWKEREENGKVVQSLDNGLIQVHVYTGHTSIYLSWSGPMLTVEQVERLAMAPELDLFRP